MNGSIDFRPGQCILLIFVSNYCLDIHMITSMAQLNEYIAADYSAQISFHLSVDLLIQDASF